MTLKTILDPPDFADFALLFSSTALKSLHTEAKRPPQVLNKASNLTSGHSTELPALLMMAGPPSFPHDRRFMLRCLLEQGHLLLPRVWKMMSNYVVVGSQGTGLVGLVDGSPTG